MNSSDHVHRNRKVALITGSAKGLGRATAITLAEMGFDIAVNYLSSRQEADELARLIRETTKVQCRAYQADIANRQQIQQLVHQIENDFGGIHVLVNNAGPFVRERRLFSDYTLDEMEYYIRANLLAVMELDSLVLPMMRRQRWGRIIHFGFAHAAESRGWPHRSVYAAAKVGLVSFTKTLAVEEAGFGITVNMICPGDIRGDNKEKQIEEVRHLIDEETPLGRPGTGEDIARVIAFLCEEKSDFITGNIMDVSGGLDPIRTLLYGQKKL